MNILSFIYVPTKEEDIQMSYEIKEGRCVAGIPATGKNIWRCSNRAKTEISGYSFCTQHAKIIKAKINQED